MPKSSILPSVAPKPLLGSKSFRGMTPPKVRFIRPNKVKKVFRDPPKSKKIDFLKKPKFCDFSEHGGLSREWPQPP